LRTRIAELNGGVEFRQLFRDDDAALHEPLYDWANTEMDDQLGGDQQRKRDQESDLRLEVA
jgi:hypothetical protein